MLNLSGLILPVNQIERTNLKESEEEDNYHFQQMYLTVNAALVYSCSFLLRKGFA